MYLFLRLGLVLVALAIVLPACDGGSDTADCPYCLTEDFSEAGGGWPVRNEETREYGFADGEYVATIKQPGTWFPGPDQFDAEGNRLAIEDSTISVTGRVTQGTPVMGLYCRQTSNPLQAYAFGVLEGQWALRGGEGATIEKGDLPEGTDITEPTKLELSCVGDELTVSINDTILTTAQDSRLSAGANGVLLASKKDPTLPATVAYDDFEITEPDE